MQTGYEEDDKTAAVLHGARLIKLSGNHDVRLERYLTSMDSSTITAPSRSRRPVTCTRGAVPILASLLHRVEETDDGCWQWTGGLRSRRSGFGGMRAFGRVWLTHQIAWVLFLGPLPDGRLVVQACDNRLCCRPEHLAARTRRDLAANRP